MSRKSITSFLVLCLIALLVNLVRPTPSESSYMWKPALQLTTSQYSASPKSIRWGAADTFEVHSIYKECFSPSGCRGSQLLWYFNVGSAGWQAAAAAAHQITRVQSPSGRFAARPGPRDGRGQ